MKVYELRDPAHLRRRAHPWVDADADPSHRYYDFRRHPELIRSSLEDLLPWSEAASTETFFQLIEWLNGPESTLESNDCAFNGLSANDGSHSDLRFEASGRLMVLFRDLACNTSPARVGNLAQSIARALSLATPSLEEGVVGVSIVEVQVTTLPGPPARQRGQQVMLSFWAWGDDEGETLSNLNLTLVNLGDALRTASSHRPRQKRPL
jgi:hypothetical protein